MSSHQNHGITPLRRDVLNRMFEAARPLSIAEAMDGHPNIMPMLCRRGWAKYVIRPPAAGYVITDKGMEAIGFEIVESEASLSSQERGK